MSAQYPSHQRERERQYQRQHQPQTQQKAQQKAPLEHSHSAFAQAADSFGTDCSFVQSLLKGPNVFCLDDLRPQSAQPLRLLWLKLIVRQGQPELNGLPMPRASQLELHCCDLSQVINATETLDALELSLDCNESILVQSLWARLPSLN